MPMPLLMSSPNPNSSLPGHWNAESEEGMKGTQRQSWKICQFDESKSEKIEGVSLEGRSTEAGVAKL